MSTSIQCTLPKTITLFVRVNNPDFGQMHLKKEQDAAGRTVFTDNVQNSDINDPNNPVHMELLERLCTGWFDLPTGSPKTLLSKLPKGALLGVTINPVTRVIFEIWQPHGTSLKVGCPGKPIWGF